MVALYFSAEWCPSCLDFTPKLKKFYEEGVNSGLEIVFISIDKSAKKQEAYLKEYHGNWLYIPYGDASIETLKKNYNTRHCIPFLVLLQNDGSPTMAIENFVDDVEMDHLTMKEILKKWADKIV
uniref:Thioredoxin domain-containing protein n=1 Tax=Panagrellus redivivus TaxID=6233 RepID=A0A7E4W2F7_PANRE